MAKKTNNGSPMTASAAIESQRIACRMPARASKSQIRKEKSSKPKRLGRKKKRLAWMPKRPAGMLQLGG